MRCKGWFNRRLLCQVQGSGFKGSEVQGFRGLGWLLAACFLLLADPETSGQEPVTRSQRPGIL
jgi:hypothetical protein